MFVVIKPFRDLQDNNFMYKAGDVFPRDGMEVSDDRIKELSGNDNKLGKPLIEKQKQKTAKKREKNAD